MTSGSRRRVTDWPGDLGQVVARMTLVVAPLLAFRVFPVGTLPLAAMVLPLAILAAFYVRTPDVRVPIWEAALLGLLTLSLLWSDVSDFTVEELRIYLPLTLATMLAASLVSSTTVLSCLKTSFAILVATSLLVIAADPGGAFRVGQTGQDLRAQFDKNTYGGLLVVALLLVVEHRRRLNFLLVPGLVVLLALNRSATAWVVAALLVIATYVGRRMVDRLGPSARPQLAILGLIVLGSGLALVFYDPDSAVGAVGKSTTLSGRTHIWAACWPLVEQAPWIGHGAFAFLNASSHSPVTQAVWAQFQGYRPPHPHNGFLDLAGQLGAAGVVVFVALLGGALRRGTDAALSGDSAARTAVLCLVFVLVFGVTEPTYLGQWLVVTFMLVAVASPRHRAATAPAQATIMPARSRDRPLVAV